MSPAYPKSKAKGRPQPRTDLPGPPIPHSAVSIPSDQKDLISQFIEALISEIEALKKGRGGSIVTVHDGNFIRQEGPFFVYVFSTESPLVVMDDAPAEVEVGASRFPGQIISVQGSEVAVGIEHDFGQNIPQAKIITNLWYLLEALRKRYDEVLKGERELDATLGARLFGLERATSQRDSLDLDLPPSRNHLNDEQIAAIRYACGSDIHFIWGPPGTGKTKTIGFLIAVLLERGLRVLVVSHTNVATDHAIRSVAELLEHTDDYQSGKFVRFGNISPNVELPPMVIPAKIAETLGKRFRDNLVQLRAELATINTQISALREAEAAVNQQRDLQRSINELKEGIQRLTSEFQKGNLRIAELSKLAQATRSKLAEAQTAGAFKRLLRGLNPAKLQLQIDVLEVDLSTVQRSTASCRMKMTEMSSCLTDAESRESQVRQEVASRLEGLKFAMEEIGLGLRNTSKKGEDLKTAIRMVELELEAITSKILREAKLVATSLTKATISKEIDGNNFDALVVDEVSMAPMPALYFATGRASKKTVVVGDFRQLPPICSAETEIAKKWLGRDIFHQAGIQRAVDEGISDPRLTLLRRQYRMDPDISAIANKVFYQDRLVDSVGPDDLEKLICFREHSVLGQNALLLYDVSSVNPWSSRLDQGGRYNLYSAVLSAEIARRAASRGSESIGVISPYAVHARLIKMILDELDDPNVRHLKVSTVHKFQGLEQDTIIFDVAEGPMPRYGPSGLVDGTDLESQAAKLINVSITRPKAQLAIVANVSYLRSRLQRDAILLRVLQQVCTRGRIIDSREILPDYFCSDYERWAGILDPRDDGIDPNDGSLYTDRNFYAAFFADLRNSQKEIIVVSPFLTAARAQTFFDLFRAKVASGLQIRVFTRTRQEQQGDMFRQAEMVFDGLKAIGVQIVERRGLHQKFAFIDRQIAWEGSLNILSQGEGRTTEHMRRLPFAKTCAELIALHKFGSDDEVPPGTRQRIQTDHKCEIHGVPMVLVAGPHGHFLGCPKFPACEYKYPIRGVEQIRTDVKCAGRDGTPCGHWMVAVRGRYGVYLRCSSSDCKQTRRI